MATGPVPAKHAAGPRTAVLSATAAIGLACVLTQLVLMREMLSAFAGNEMVFGVVLGLWLLLTGLGTMLGRTAQKLSDPVRVLVIGQVLVALAPMCQVFALRSLRDFVFVRGSDVDLTGTILCAAVVLAPFCLVAGYTLVLACSILARANDRAGTGRVYVADSIGSIVGGVMFTFVLVHFLDHIALLSVSAGLNLVLAGWIALKHQGMFETVKSHARRRVGVLVLLPVVALGLTSVFILAQPDALSTAMQFRGQKVLFRANSPYGRLIVTDSGAQTNFIENGVVVVYTPNIEQVEEAAHYALCQRPDARRVLLVSGGAAGIAREILKYNVATIDCVELDPLIVRVTRRFLPENVLDERINMLTTDARRFIRHTTNRYDFVVLALPDPTTAQLNRFFTAEFFGEIKRVLTEGGVFAFSLGRYENYISPELGKLLSSAYRTLRLSFEHVLLLPAGRVYFLASDNQLEPDIARQIEKLGVRTKLVNRNYLEAIFTSDRFADMQRAVLHPAAINSDFSPVIYYYALRHWLSQFESGIGPLQVLLVGIMLVYMVRLRSVTMVLFASGFAGSALEIVLLFAFQVLAGAVYQQVGMIVTLFMVGLAVGAGAANRMCTGPVQDVGQADNSSGMAPAGADPARVGGSSNIDGCGFRKNQHTLIVLALAICGLALVMPIVFNGLASVARLAAGDLLVQCYIGLLIFLLGCLVGAQFPIANRIETGGTLAASRLFTADFMGAFLGALLVSTLLIPLLGVATSCIATAVLNLLAALVMWRAKMRS